MNPQTKTFDFLSSETPQNEIDSYQPSLAQSITMFKGEPDYEAVFDMLFNRATGKEAHRDALICFYKEQGATGGTVSYKLTADTAIAPAKTYYTRGGTSGHYTYSEVTSPVLADIDKYYGQVAAAGITVYKAWKIDALITINQLDSVNENIDFDLALNEIVNGAVEISASGMPSFTEGKWNGSIFTPAA